jgi:hypothetical protein
MVAKTMFSDRQTSYNGAPAQHHARCACPANS